MEGGTLLCEISEKWGVSGTPPPPPLSLDPLWLCEELYSDHCHKKNCSLCYYKIYIFLQMNIDFHKMLQPLNMLPSKYWMYYTYMHLCNELL